MSELTTVNTRHPIAGRSFELAAWLAETRALAVLGGPVILTQLAQMAMPTTDIIMVGYLGQAPLAAASLAHTMWIFAWIVGMGPASAVAPIIAHVLGAQPSNRAGVRAAVRMGFWAVLWLTPPLLFVMIFAEPLLLLLGQEPALARLAAPFIQILAPSVPFALGFIVLRNFATALSRPRAPLVVMLAAVVLNFALDYLLIFGNWGFPNLGLLGAAVATTASNIFCFATLALLLTFARPFRTYRIWRRFTRPDWPRLRETFRLGTSIGVTTIFEVALFAGAAFLMGRFGTATLAAHQIALNVPSITFMVPLGLAMAASVRVGLAAGRNDAPGVRRAGFTAIGVAVAYMTVSAIVMASFPRAIASLYLDIENPANAEAVAIAVSLLTVAAAFQVLDGIQVIAGFALRGLKDIHAPMWLCGISYWLIGLPLAVYLGFGTPLAGVGVWIGLAGSLLAAATLLLLRFVRLSGAIPSPAASAR